jgi:hypothetical protein
MFLAHFSNTGLDVLLDWKLNKLGVWYERAVKLHNKLNSTEKEEE